MIEIYCQYFLEMMFFFAISDTGDEEGKKKKRVLPTGVEPMTFWLLVQILCH